MDSKHLLEHLRVKSTRVSDVDAGSPPKQPSAEQPQRTKRRQAQANVEQATGYLIQTKPPYPHIPAVQPRPNPAAIEAPQPRPEPINRPSPIDNATVLRRPLPSPEFVLIDTDELRAKYPGEPVGFDRETGKVVIIDLKLFAIDLAMKLDAQAIKLFMGLADGREPSSSSGYDWSTGAYYGPRDPSSGYDWRDIRDSSNAAKDRMFIEAQRILKQHRPHLSQFGLPDDVIEALVNAT
jgi:hypothetical protein